MVNNFFKSCFQYILMRLNPYKFIQQLLAIKLQKKKKKKKKIKEEKAGQLKWSKQGKMSKESSFLRKAGKNKNSKAYLYGEQAISISSCEEKKDYHLDTNT